MVEYSRKPLQIVKSKLIGGNLVEIIFWAGSPFRQGAGVIIWSVEEINGSDKKKRNFLTRYVILHPKVSQAHCMYQDKEVKEDIPDANKALEQQKTSCHGI